MPRNCLIAIIVWIVLFLGYAFFFYNSDLPFERALGGGAIMSVLMIIGLGMINGSRYADRDRRAMERFRRGERPRDGEVAAVVGEVWPALDPLRAPISGRDCVIYRYDIGPPRGGQSVARDYIGFAFTRCAIRTPYGSYALGSFPVLNGFSEDRQDSARAREYIEATEFEQLSNVLSLAKDTLALHHQPPPLRVDWRFGMTSGDAEEAKELIVASGTRVTAFGKYSPAANALVSGTKDEGYLRLYRGETVSLPPSSAMAQVITGIVLIIVANVGMWFVLQNLTTR